MKTLGIIGGIAPESTIEYYRFLIARYRERKADGSYPQFLINSINLQALIGMVTANDLSALVDYIVPEIQKLAAAGADFGLMASNTPHLVFDEIARRSPIPLISIIEATAERAKSLGLKRLGLFGTRFTMQGRAYPGVFSRDGIALVTPRADEQDYIHEKYMGELVNGVILDETRAGLLAIAGRLRDEERIEGLILGGTELPLILRDGPDRGIPFLDTTQIHVDAAVAQMLEN